MNRLSIQQQDLQWLQNQPKRLLQKYQPLIAKVVQLHLQTSAYTTFPAKELLKKVYQQLLQQLLRLYKRHGKRSHIRTLILEASRMLCHHLEDLYLLENQPATLVVKYEAMIANQTLGYVNTGNLPEHQVADIIQYVSERLLSKLQADKLNYQNCGALFRTYFYQIINNAIKDGLRRLQTKKAAIGSGTELKAHHAVSANTFKAIHQKMDLEKQCQLYQKLLRQFKQLERCKFELSAKVSYYLLLEEGDVKLVLVSDQMRVELVVCFGKDYTALTKEKLWNTLVPFANAIDGKSIGGNGLYRWFSRRRNMLLAKILYVMNFNGKLEGKLNDTEKMLFAKLNQRAVGKFAEEYFGEIVYGTYRSA